METFLLLDDEQHASLRDDLSLYEAHKTRLLRVDLGTRSQTDPFQRWLRKYLRASRYWRLLRKARSNSEGLGSVAGRQQRWSYQSTNTNSQGNRTCDDCGVDGCLYHCTVGHHVARVVKQHSADSCFGMHYSPVFPCVALPKGVELRDDGGICRVRCCSFGVRFQCPCKRGAIGNDTGKVLDDRAAGRWISLTRYRA
jgi:hypothetical protein